MSFSTDIKNEVTRTDVSREELISELSAIVRNSATIDKFITIYIENNSVTRRIFKLFKNIYDISPVITVRRKLFNKGYSYILIVKNKVNTILDDLSIMKDKQYQDIPKDYIYSDTELIRAYLRGLFLVTGSVNDPKTSKYHLEFLVDTDTYANFIVDLLANFNLLAKVIKREKKYMVYLKEAEKISDFLRIIMAYNAVMYYEDIRIYRDHKNMTNRLNNCEQANIDKIFITASRTLKDIEKIKVHDLYDIQDEKIRLVMDYRLKYPEASLNELSEIITKDTGENISKSGLNHRFRKIREIANNIDK